MNQDELLTPLAERDQVLGSDDAPATALVYADASFHGG